MPGFFRKQENSLESKATVKTIRKNLKDMKTTDASPSPNDDSAEASSSVPVAIKNDKKRGIASSSSGSRIAHEEHEVREGDRFDEEYEVTMSPRKRMTRRNTSEIGIRSGESGVAAAAAVAAAAGNESDKSVEGEEADNEEEGDEDIDDDNAEPMAMSPKTTRHDSPVDNETPDEKDGLKNSLLSPADRTYTAMSDDWNEPVEDEDPGLQPKKDIVAHTATIPAIKPSIALFGGGGGTTTDNWIQPIEDYEYEEDETKKAELAKAKVGIGATSANSQAPKPTNKKYVFGATTGLGQVANSGSASVASETGFAARSVWGSSGSSATGTLWSTGSLSGWGGSSTTPTINNSSADNTGAMAYTGGGGDGPGNGFGSLGGGTPLTGGSNISSGSSASVAKTEFGFSAFSSSSTSPFATFGTANTTAPTASSATTIIPTIASSTPSFASLASSASSPFASVTANSASPFGLTITKPSAPRSSSAVVSSPFAVAAQASTTRNFGNLLAKSGKESKEDDELERDDDDDEAEDGWDDNSGAVGTMFGEGNKVKVPGVHETEVRTGEEEESTIYQVKAKLYVMDAQQQWKERGIGNLRLNMRRNNRHAVRLVMRADSVFRVILNVPLFPGMSCELAQEKFVRIIVIEDGHLTQFAIKVSNKNIAEELYETLRMSIPAKSKEGDGVAEEDEYGDEADYEETRFGEVRGGIKWA
ncbi:hypothetical protein BC936DRAFT_148280 [Jimgerdemannia flammicorona]|uniref:RanBD1 domain-containing protein n=1 Tax=Jimgerdemannia flammicorona TaxID=994334 RepID=A0A433D3J3_9FUNG|nr:hypothetical protein BC936DRAFT_148280 [Jimgerdemannia flammicorona]